jgi:hypothetical protein
MDRFFSRTQPWSALDFMQRVARVGRILVGLALFAFFIWILVAAVLAIPITSAVSQRMFEIFVIPYLLVLLYCIGRMFIWRPVIRSRFDPLPPAANPPYPPTPPDEGAPRPAPLRPITPLILSAHAEIPREAEE